MSGPFEVSHQNDCPEGRG